MPRWRSAVLWSLALGAIGFLVVETARLAEVAGRFEAEARDARAAADASRAAPAAAPVVPSAEPPPDALSWAQLELELHACKQKLAAVTTLLEQKNAEQEQRALAAAEREQPLMPEGVRLCLAALQTCLRTEGFANQRFLVATSLDQEGLHDVQMIDAEADGLGTMFVTAKRMTAIVDRGAGRLDLRFHDGHRTSDGGRIALPKDGWLLSFRDIDGRMFEAKVPVLVRGEGSYPAVEPEGKRPVTDVDPFTRREWLARLERVVSGGGAVPAWRIGRFRGMQDGWFLDADLVASDERNRVVGSASCKRLAIEVDRTTGVVSLLLQSGVLHHGALESTITAEGYRILLPKLKLTEAGNAMLGMVVTK